MVYPDLNQTLLYVMWASQAIAVLQCLTHTCLPIQFSMNFLSALIYPSFIQVTAKARNKKHTRFWKLSRFTYLAMHGEGAWATLEELTPKCSLRVREYFIATSFLHRNIAIFKTDWHRRL